MTKFNIIVVFGDSTEFDANAREQDNLYLAVKSKWLNDTSITAGESSINGFDIVDQQTSFKRLFCFCFW